MKMSRWFILIVLFNSIPILAREKSQFLFSREQGGISLSDTVYPILSNTQSAPNQKSENTAFMLSFLSTAAPAVVGGAMLLAGTSGDVDNTFFIVTGIITGSTGIVFGPAVGYFYGGRAGRGVGGIALRLGFGAAGFGGILLSFRGGFEDVDETQFLISFIGGSALILASSMFDVAMVKSAVRKRNEALQKTGWMVTPTYFAKHKAGGLELQVRF